MLKIEEKIKLIRRFNKNISNVKVGLFRKKKNYRMGYDSSCSKVFVKKLNDQYNAVRPRNFRTYTIMNKHILQNLTLKQLRQISRENKVNLKGRSQKQEIINLL